jgi:tryptophanyl-tRNA synthetase
MSKSKPRSCISIPEEPKEVKSKIMDALTGGRRNAEEQKRLGGEPEKCMVFELYKQHLIEKDEELDEIYQQCKSGGILCGPCKERAFKLMEKFMKDFEKKMKKAKKIIPKLKFINSF